MNKDDVIRWASHELDSREFCDVMQAYRHGQDPKETPEAFEAVKGWIRKNISLAYAAGAEAEREALRQITPEVIEAGCESLYGHTRAEAIEWAKEDKFDGYAYTAEQAFRMMIDAAIRARGNGGE